MESKKINRNFNSIFWCLIYSMPLFSFIVLFFGYVLSYHQTGNFNELNIINIVLSDTNEIFNQFIWFDLYNVFNNLFDSLSFNVTSDISIFIMITFTWFVQGMFLHILVDTLTLVPKMYHKLMERWL